MAGGVAIALEPGKNYPGKMTWFVFFACFVAAWGGLIFGYDIGISGGVTAMRPFLKKFFPSVYRKEIGIQSANQYCRFDSEVLTLFTSSLYLAALISSLFASKITRRFGRRLTMLLGGLVFLFGAVINGAAVNVAMLIIGRLLLGVGVGFANQSVPLYLSEMAPYKFRGALNICFQLSITIGILAANVINYFTDKIKAGWGWRVSLAGAGVPALCIVLGALVLPDTPNSVIERSNPEHAKKLLRKIRGTPDIDQEYEDLVAASEASKRVDDPWGKLLKNRKYRPHLTMAILIPFFQQITGINVVMFYAPVLFKTLGFGNDASLMSAVITGVVNVGATIVSIFLVDRKGRRFLFLEGGAQMFIFQFAVGGLIWGKFGTDGIADIGSGYAALVVACICTYVAGFAWSWGPLGWLVPSEIFPLEIRSAAQSVNVAVNMFFTFVIAQIFLKMLCGMKFGLFFFFGGFVFIMSVFVYFFLPETKGIPIEEMSQVWKNHWWWGRYVTDDDVELEQKSELLGIANMSDTFSYAELKTATGDFSSGNKLGEGGFGPVYKGKLSDEREVAVKKLLVTSHQGKSQFVAEISIISAVQHRNLVRLYGCCIEGQNRLLVYEYLQNKSLDQALFGKNALNLDWPTRYNICLGAARGLAYLHEESKPRIVHRDVKASNILLDTELNPKISDFGLAKLYDDKKTHISTRPAGTIGYLAPEYAMRGHLTEKADVFGFGVVALEILCGRQNTDTSLDPERVYLLEWAWSLYESNRGLDLVDPTLNGFNEEEATKMLGIALLCTQASPMMRPSMSRVVVMLTGDAEVSTVTSKPSYLTDWQFSDMSSFVCEDGTSGVLNIQNIE